MASRENDRAATLAQQLAARFLVSGNYVFAAALSRHGAQEVIPAAATGAAEVDRYFSEEYGFAGLAVQSVGYEEGAPDPKVHVYVTKGPRAKDVDLANRDTGVTVEINRVGRVIVRPEAASSVAGRGNLFERGGRVACGSSCAPSGESYAGTLGALVRKRGSQALFALSNNHVFAAGNHVPVGMPILSPSPMDTQPDGSAPREVCRHSEICELRSGVPTLVVPSREDIALAQVADGSVISSWQGSGNGSYDTPTRVVAPRSGVRVKKFGRTTGLTVGTVEAFINTPFAIPYKCRFFAATVWFQDVWTVRADQDENFALPGDSGSLVVTENHDAAVGLVFAATPSGEYGYIIPMTHIATQFGGDLTLVGRHGV